MTPYRPAWVTALSLLTLVGCTSNGSASTAVVASAALSAAPATSASATASPTPAAAAARSASASSSARTGGLDVDGDGVTDTVTTRFLAKHKAVLEVHLGGGKSLTSKAFTLYAGDGAGKVTGYDIDGNHTDEVFVEAPGADGIGYDLFAWSGSALVAVPPPKGQEAPYLYVGGGRYYESSFRCTGRTLIEVNEVPAVASTSSLPADPPFRVTLTTYRLADAALSVVGTRTVHAPDRAAAQALLADRSDGCGTKPSLLLLPSAS